MNKELPDASNLEHLKTQAKRLLEAVQSNDVVALERVRPVFPRQSLPGAPPFKLAAAQLVIAREYGFGSWQRLRNHVIELAGKTEAAAQPTKFRQIVAELHLADVASAAKFFEECLGFKRGHTISYPDGTLDFAVMVNDPVEILLHNISADIRPDAPKHVRFYFRAYDAAGLHTRLSTQCRHVSNLVKTNYGTLEFTMIGPEGYRLVFQQFV